MATEDYSAALQALSILTDTATSFKKMEFASDEAERSFNRQQQASKEQFKMQADNQRDLMMLDNTLELEQTSYSNYTNLLKEARELGVTYNDLKSPGAQKIYEEMTDEKVREIKEIKGNIHSLKGFNLELGNRISVRQKDQLDKANKLIELKSAESTAQIAASTEAIATSKAKRDEITRIGELTYIEQVTKLHREPLTALKLDGDKYENAVTGYSGKLNSMIYNEFSTATNSELAEWSEEGFQESDERVRYDPDKGMYTYNDAKYMDAYIKRQAKQLAIENQFNENQIGLTPEDIANETEQYKVFESKFITTATDGLKANPEFKATGGIEYTALESTVNDLMSKDPEIIEAKAELNNIGPQVTALFTTTDGDETEISSDAVDTIEAKLKAAGTPLSEQKIKKYLNDVLAFSGSPMTMRKLLVENPDFQKIISATGSLGGEYVKLLQRLDREISRKSPFVPGVVKNENLLNQTRGLWNQAKQP